MIDRTALLRDLQREVKALEDDLRARAVAEEATDARLRREHTAARTAGRTAERFESWRDDQVTQSAVAWVLAGVFVRFLEDNGLLPEPLISGPGPRRQLALDHRQLFFRAHPTDTDREYLHDVFRMVAKLPAAGDVLGAKHNPLWSLAPSGDGATRLLEFFQRVPPETGELAHDFTDPEWNTRFLGDLYQDLSEAARKKFALLQTPEFVEAFILDRTLTPAIAEFSYNEVRLIDPTCGSGHFLLGAFRRLFELHVRHEPGTNPRELAQRALHQIAGVDVNPFAVAIARFRLLLAALKASRIERLADAPGFRMHLAAGDSLLHGRRFGLATMNLQPKLLGDDPLRKHVYEAEDADALTEILGRQYHVVVGNPPYITVKDKALNEAYRDAYSSCHMKYSLGVPFTERFFELALSADDHCPAGFVGMITTNSFMKREFGRKLIKETLPKLDLTHVIDTSGAYIPGHGTPTVILFGRNRSPVADEIRTVMGIRGEPQTPDDPARGIVWHAIVQQLDIPGSESEFISVTDNPRARFREHPWAMGGGGAAELKALIESASDKRLGDLVESIGFGAILGEDDAFGGPPWANRIRSLPEDLKRPLVVGELVRDWGLATKTWVLFPYDMDIALRHDAIIHRWLWPLRTTLWARADFSNNTFREAGRAYWEYHQIPTARNQTPLSITFAFVATHNHFALDRGGKVFNRTAPIIKLPPNATEEDHFALLALLNSSTACFWMKQVMSCKGLGGQGGGIKPEDWHRQYEHDSTKLKMLPVPAKYSALGDIGRRLDEKARYAVTLLPDAVLAEGTDGLAERMRIARIKHEATQRSLVALQEELDWRTYALFGLTRVSESVEYAEVEGLSPEMRPVEVLVRSKMAEGERSIFYETQPFRGTGDIQQPSPSVARLLADRIEAIRSEKNLSLIETLNHKRRWQAQSWEAHVRDAAHFWLVSRLEKADYWPSLHLQSTAQLADQIRQDDDAMRVAELYAGHPDFELTDLVRKLVEDNAVPALPSCRYTSSGLQKRAEWLRTWELHRHEDVLDARTRLDPIDPGHLTDEVVATLKKSEVGDIPVPPNYASADFLRSGFWQLRGKLDVPKERFVSFPYCEREADPSLIIAWAGWDHLQLAQATAGYYVAMKDTDGWSRDRLTPLLAVLADLVPWLLQWHNELDPEYGVGMGDYFANFVDGETRSLGLTPADLKSWTTPKGNAAQRKKRAQRETA